MVLTLNFVAFDTPQRPKIPSRKWWLLVHVVDFTVSGVLEPSGSQFGAFCVLRMGVPAGKNMVLEGSRDA